LADTIPARVPVRNTHRVDTRSIAALSFGACSPKGWVINKNAYSKENTEPANTMARIIPIATINLACNSSGLSF
jgi:hypothetical protein